MENDTINFKPIRCIIVGAGYSIRNGDTVSKGKDLKIWNKIKNEFTIGINYSYRFFDPTVNLFCDWEFYKNFKEDIDKMPLAISVNHGKLLPPKTSTNFPVGNNVYLLKKHNKYQGINSFSEGVFSCVLSGVFALTTAINLGFQEIYLLGYDFIDTDGKTHFYQNEIEHRGVGIRDKIKNGKKCRLYKTGVYNRSPNKYFSVFEKAQKRIKIINVTNNSTIETFEKIDYNDFFKILEKDNAVVLQSRARAFVEQILTPHRIN